MIDRTAQQTVFLDANVLIYYLDETVEFHTQTLSQLEELLNNGAQLYTSHHAIEEVLHAFYHLTHDKQLTAVVPETLQKLPISLVEPEPALAFAEHYAHIFIGTNIGLNDCLLLQLVLDNHLTDLYTYDVKLQAAARQQGIQLTLN